MNTEKSLPSVWISATPLLLLIGLIGGVVALYGDNALGGASQVALLVASAFCVAVGLATRHLTFEMLDAAIKEKMSAIAVAMLILLLIGALGGSWMVSGIVPTMIYYGVQFLHPTWFLVCACIISALVSVMTGSSWTTIATVGIALMSIGVALGFTEGWVAGAIISGAYFGDKISPLSDTTVMASSTVGTPLFTHISYMLRTTIPTFCVALVTYMIVGIITGAHGHGDVEGVRTALAATFNISPWLLIVPGITAIMIARRWNTLVILFLGIAMACVAAVFSQSELLFEIAGAGERTEVNAIRGMMTMIYGSTSLDTGVESLNSLVATRGMSGMMNTIWLFVCAMTFGAAMTATGMLESLMRALLKLAHGTISLISSTVATGIFMNMSMSDQYLAIIVTGSMYKETYEKQGYESRLLSRTIEDSATVTSVLVPWNTCGMTQSSVLGVSALVYAPYCVFNYLSPLMTILVTYIMRHRLEPKVNKN